MLPSKKPTSCKDTKWLKVQICKQIHHTKINENKIQVGSITLLITKQISDNDNISNNDNREKENNKIMLNSPGEYSNPNHSFSK